MIFSAVIAAAYLLMFVSKRKGLFFAGLILSMLTASFITARAFFPLFYEYFLLHFTHVAAAADKTSFMVQESLNFIKYYWVLCILYLFYILKTHPVFFTGQFKSIRLGLADLD
jgi:hypothetical protein